MWARRIGRGRVVYTFEIEIGDGGGQGEEMRRARFAWMPVLEKVEEEMKHGGFKLVWLAGGSGSGDAQGASSSNQADRFAGFGARNDDEGEIVASFAWSNWLWNRWFFKLQFLGSGLSGVLGERWKLMVVTTAVRLVLLRND
jgi:hypothetical protein